MNRITAQAADELRSALDDGDLPSRLGGALNVGSDTMLLLETVDRALAGRVPEATRHAIDLIRNDSIGIDPLCFDLVRRSGGGTDPAIVVALALALKHVRIEHEGGAIEMGVDDNVAPNGQRRSRHPTILVELGPIRVMSHRSAQINVPLLPETVMAAMPGRRLAEIVSHPLLDIRDHVVA